MLAQASFDLVLLDIMMPEMNGFEVLQHLKADDALRHLPVILISALEDGVREAAGELARALGLQVVGSFRKPLGQNQLRAALAC